MTRRTTKTKVCTKCGKRKPLSSGFYYHRQRKWYMESCKECNSTTCLEYQQTSDYRERPSYVFYQRAYRIASDAARKGIITEDSKALKATLLQLWERQKGRCFYTKEPMTLTGWPAPDAATVDRVVPVKGYVAGNLVLCRSLVNRSKQEMGWDELVAFCRLVVKNDRRVKTALKKIGARE